MGVGDEKFDFVRKELLIQQLYAIVHSTTGSTTFKEVVRRGIENRWIEKVFVRGLTSQGKILQQIEIEIDWKDHPPRVVSIRYSLNQNTIQITEVAPNRIALVSSETIKVFQEVNEVAELKAVWAVSYTPEANAHREEVSRILGLRDTEPGEQENAWKGQSLTFIHPKLKELSVSWEIAVSPTDTSTHPTILTNPNPPSNTD